MKTQHFSWESSYFTNNTVRQWSANCGPRPSCGPFSTFYCAVQHLWAALYVNAKVLRWLRGIKQRLL